MDSHHINKSGETLPADTPALDFERYMPLVEERFATEEEASAFLRTLWEIMCAFVDIGWGVDSIHLVFPELAEFYAEAEADALHSSGHQTIKEEFEAALTVLPASEDS